MHFFFFKQKKWNELSEALKGYFLESLLQEGMLSLDALLLVPSRLAISPLDHRNSFLKGPRCLYGEMAAAQF